MRTVLGAAVLLFAGLMLPTLLAAQEDQSPEPLLEESRLYLEGDYRSDAVVRDNEIVWWELSGEIVIRYRSNQIETEFARYERENYQLSFPRGLLLENRWGNLRAESGDLFLKEEDRFELSGITDGELEVEDTGETINFTTDRISGSLRGDETAQVELSGNVDLNTYNQRLQTDQVTVNLEQRSVTVPPRTPLTVVWQVTRDSESDADGFFAEGEAELTGRGLDARWSEEGEFSFTLEDAEFRQSPLSGRVPSLEGIGTEDGGLHTLRNRGGEQVSLQLDGWPAAGDRAEMVSSSFELDLEARTAELSGGVVITSDTVDMETERVIIERKDGGEYRVLAPQRSRINIDDRRLRERVEMESESADDDQTND